VIQFSDYKVEVKYFYLQINAFVHSNLLHAHQVSEVRSPRSRGQVLAVHGPCLGDIVGTAAGLEQGVVCLFCHVLLDRLFGCKSVIIRIKLYI